MKKILVIVAALIVVAACAAPPTNREVTSTANTNSAVDVAMTETEAIPKEKAAWEAIKNKDYDGFANMVAADAFEVTPTGVNDKAQTVANVRDFEPSEFTFSDWKFLSLDKDAFVVTYSVNSKGKYKGTEFQESARASSGWVKRDGKWVSIYHQECEIKPASPPPPPAKTKATATAAPSPAASPVITTTGPDVAADEKIVWDFFKSKNYDGFASVLADDFIEVEPDGFYDKAASVKSVQFDASKAELSDWKVVKIDDDASLVTYLVKIPGMAPDGERHTSIWTSRAGKWLARFHHGTPVAKEQAMPAAKASPVASASPKASASATPKASVTPKASATPR
jgi:hypothetical protein